MDKKYLIPAYIRRNAALLLGFILVLLKKVKSRAVKNLSLVV